MKKKLSIALVASLILIGCGSSTTSEENQTITTSEENQTITTSEENQTTIKTIQVVDGYIINATVCIDKNNNYSCDNEDENITETNTSGEYSYISTYDNYNHLIIGGEDNVTNTPNSSILIKPAGLETNVINPFTTLVADYIDENNVTLDEAKQKIASVLGINEEDITKNPLTDTTLTKIVAKLNIIKSLTKQDYLDLAKKINNATSINDLCDNNQTIINILTDIDNLTTTSEEIEKKALEYVLELQTPEIVKVNEMKEIYFDGQNPAYVELNLTEGNYTITAESATKTPYSIKIDYKNILENGNKIYDDTGKLIATDINITSIDAQDVAPSMNIVLENNNTLKIPFYVYNKPSGTLVEANISIATVKEGFIPKYSHEINITDTIKNAFYYKTQPDEYYTFEINSSTAGTYELNVYGVLPNPLGNFVVKLSDGTKNIIDDIEDDFNYSRTVTLENGKTYTLTISITDSKLPAVRDDYIGNYEIKFIKQ